MELAIAIDCGNQALVSRSIMSIFEEIADFRVHFFALSTGKGTSVGFVATELKVGLYSSLSDGLGRRTNRSLLGNRALRDSSSRASPETNP